MEIQLQELIEQIKKDGVDAAEAEAAAILAAANDEAAKIVADAKAQAEKLMQDAKAENTRAVRAGEDALRQAGRNLLISFRESVTRELDALLGERVAAVYSSDALTALVAGAMQAWANTPDAQDIAVLVNGADLAALQAGLLAALKDKACDGITLKAADDFHGGFRIAVNDGQAYYDYSAAAVTEMLAAYLNPRVTALLKEAQSV